MGVKKQAFTTDTGTVGLLLIGQKEHGVGCCYWLDKQKKKS